MSRNERNIKQINHLFESLTHFSPTFCAIPIRKKQNVLLNFQKHFAMEHSLFQSEMHQINALAAKRKKIQLVKRCWCAAEGRRSMKLETRMEINFSCVN